ncbi:MAG: hypothetical protein NTY34_02350 [Candidatus Omnitrophica bacterium]|nr:hypothetical protein [Candidatus Omnitrophota bacterium]
MSVFEIKDYKYIPEHHGDFEEWSFTISDAHGGTTILPVQLSGTLYGMWALGGQNEYDNAVHSITNSYLKEQELLGIKSATKLKPIKFNTYNAPQEIKFIKVGKHEKAEPVILPPKDTLITGKSSSLRYKIAEKRDHINIFFEEKYKFRLFNIKEERAIVDMYEKCDTREQFTCRLLALNNLIEWINKKGIYKIINQPKIDEKDGTVAHLDAFLVQEFPGFNKDSISTFRAVQRISQLFPRHEDSKNKTDYLEQLGIEWPINDSQYGDAWEKILKKYFDALDNIFKSLNNQAPRK